MQRSFIILIAAFVIPSVTAAEPKKYALLIGVNKYEHAEMNKPELQFAEADVTDLAELLKSSGYEVDLLVGPKASREAVAAKIKGLAGKGNADGVVLVGLAGHGVQFEKDDDAFYCPYDTTVRRAVRDGKPVLDRNGKQIIEPDPASLVRLTDIVKEFELSKAGVRVLLADCCRNDPTTGRGRGVGSGIKTSQLPGNTAILLSCSHGQQAWEHKKWGHGAFFYHVLQGLRDGKGTVVSLSAYLEENVAKDVKSLYNAPDQDPHPLINGKRLDFGLVAGKKEPKPGEERVFDVGNGVKMTFCWIPGSNGKFKLGSPKAEQDYIVKTYYDGKRDDFLDSENEFEIAGVDGFWMAKMEMTQGQYVKLTGKKNPSWFCADGDGKDKVKGINTDEFPVENVSWYDAKECIKEMKLPSGMKKVGLPSEAQWEWACRGGRGNGRAFYWGDVLNGDKANSNGNYPYGTTTKGTYEARTTKVGSYETKAPHPWGLCDMYGNVWEWCEDYYGEYAKLPGGKNPVQTSKQSNDVRVLRGGSWFYLSWFCRSAFRNYGAPGNRINNFGFRVVFSSQD